ncbi:MAG: sulfatase-like hydrolase/transferase [Planctomycetes bacterium]|nr:sulfatase-like hydrolase/transferase [Planctomycetota bacterium]
MTSITCRLLIKLTCIAALLLCVDSLLGNDSPSENRRLPNVVFIMSDNHSPSTLGCYGNADVLTPNIDALAREGTMFNKAFSCSPACSPSRASILTGLLPCQHGQIDICSRSINNECKSKPELLDSMKTLPQILSETGYNCHAIGKFHLEGKGPDYKGFSSWTTLPYLAGGAPWITTTYIKNGKQGFAETNDTEFFSQCAVDWIKENAGAEQPFFLYLSYNVPTGYGMQNRSRNKHLEYYRKALNTIFYPADAENSEAHLTYCRIFASSITLMDEGIGSIMKTLKETDVENDTVVVFTSDQGVPAGRYGHFSRSPNFVRCLKDGCVDVPLIFRHPKHVEAGRRSDRLVSHYDLMPTLLSYLGMKGKLPAAPKQPGRDYSAELRGTRIEDWDDTIYFDYRNWERGVRTKDWMLFVARGGLSDTKTATHNEETALYDMNEDPGQTNDLSQRPEYQEIKNRLYRQLSDYFKQHAHPDYQWKMEDG